MTRLIVVLLGFMFGLNGYHAFSQQRPQQPDIPGDLMIDFGFNFFREKPEFLDLKLWPSRSIGVYYMYTHKLSDRFTVNPAIGVSAVKYAFKQNMNFQQDANRDISFDTIRGVSVERNKLAINYVELPVEIRFYPTKTIDGEGFFVGVGGVIGYRFESHTKLKYFINEERRAEKLRSDFGLNDIRAGVILRVGWKAFNVYGKYYLTDPFRNGPFGANPSTFTVGMNLTGF